jgi:DNA-binding CsgD family transcriptional regulator
VVELLVREGLTDAELAYRLTVSPRTIEAHLREVYRKAADHGQMPAFGRTQLVALLGLYYSMRAFPQAG